jgi:hypothetical protein
MPKDRQSTVRHRQRTTNKQPISSTTPIRTEKNKSYPQVKILLIKQPLGFLLNSCDNITYYYSILIFFDKINFPIDCRYLLLSIC